MESTEPPRISVRCPGAPTPAGKDRDAGAAEGLPPTISAGARNGDAQNLHMRCPPSSFFGPIHAMDRPPQGSYISRKILRRHNRVKMGLLTLIEQHEEFYTRAPSRRLSPEARGCIFC